MILDLNHYGLIGFQKEWRMMQGATGKNLLELFVDDCLASGIDGCAVTSEEAGIIPKGSVHDRFGILKKIAERSPTGLSSHRDAIREGYEILDVKDNYMVISRDGSRPIYLINTQALRVSEGCSEMKVLLVGANNLPDKEPYRENIAHFKRPDVTAVLKKYSPNRNDDDARWAMNIISRYKDCHDAVVGFNAQNPAENQKSKDFASQVGLPYVAITSKHSFSGCPAGIAIPDIPTDSIRPERFLESIKTAVRQNKCTPIEVSENPIKALAWKGLFWFGTRKNRHYNYTP